MKSCLWFNMINGRIKYQTIILKLKIFVIENYTILFLKISSVCSRNYSAATTCFHVEYITCRGYQLYTIFFCFSSDSKSRPPTVIGRSPGSSSNDSSNQSADLTGIFIVNWLLMMACYYMTESASGQVERIMRPDGPPERQAAGPSCPFGISRVGPV